MKRSSFATLALAAAALCASCSGAPSPAPKSVTEAKGAVSPVIDVPARAASKVSLPGLWYSSKGHESYQIALLADGSYLTRGRNPSGLDIEDKGVWTVSKEYLNTKSERGEERIWRIEFASEDKVILKSVKVKESLLGELIEFDRVGSRDIVGIWLDETVTPTTGLSSRWTASTSSRGRRRRASSSATRAPGASRICSSSRRAAA